MPLKLRGLHFLAFFRTVKHFRKTVQISHVIGFFFLHLQHLSTFDRKILNSVSLCNKKKNDQQMNPEQPIYFHSVANGQDFSVLLAFLQVRGFSIQIGQ